MRNERVSNAEQAVCDAFRAGTEVDLYGTRLWQVTFL
jgi:hypothetical protein